MTKAHLPYRPDAGSYEHHRIDCQTLVQQVAHMVLYIACGVGALSKVFAVIQETTNILLIVKMSLTHSPPSLSK